MSKSSPVKIKICGITERCGLQACVDNAVDWVGFVFFEKSPRFITPHAAAQLLKEVPTHPVVVGLFVKPLREQIEETLKHLPLDVLQIYDTPERARELEEHFSLPVWFSQSVSRTEDLPKTCPFERYVIEPKASANASRPGGNGQRLDWSLLSGWSPAFPWILAGGLTPDNVQAAIRQSGADAVDVSSGVESAPGAKDPSLICAFVEHARASFS